MQTSGLTYEPTYKGLAIETRPGFGLRTEILDVLEDLLHDRSNRGGTTAAVMLDIRVPPGWVCSEDNRAIKRFCRRFAAYLQQQGIASHHIWVQKHPEYSSDPHYVVVLLADAQFSWSHDLHLAKANLLWAREIETTQRGGLIDYCVLDGDQSTAPALLIRWGWLGFEGDCSSAFRALSRIARVETSTNAADDDIAFGSSRTW